jgi:uncharacterized glyoxalase superfamily protein PhnB
VYPVLRYQDVDKAIAFVEEAFGITEFVAYRDDAGQIQHAEVRWNDDLVMMGPARDGGPESGVTWVYLAADEIDSIHDRAVAAGAEILLPPTDQDYGSRDFMARDPEGHVWCFGTFRPAAHD